MRARGVECKRRPGWGCLLSDRLGLDGIDLAEEEGSVCRAINKDNRVGVAARHAGGHT